MLKNIYAIFTALLPRMPHQQDRDDAYLAEAVDIYDLERRMRELDQRGRYSRESLPLNPGYL